MKKFFIVLAGVLSILSCGKNSGQAIPGRSSDWETDGIKDNVKEKVVLTYFLNDISQTNHNKQLILKEITKYSSAGDKLEVTVFSTPFYQKKMANKTDLVRKEDLVLRAESAIFYEYTNRAGSYFKTGLYTNFQFSGKLHQEQQWVYDKQGLLIGEGYGMEDSKTRENYFLEKIYDKNGNLVEERYSGEYMGQPENYISYYQNSFLGQPTNQLQIIGSLTNISEWIYDDFNKLFRKRELDMLNGEVRIHDYNIHGLVNQSLIIKSKGQKNLYHNYYEFDKHGNVIRKWVMQVNQDRQEGLQPYSYQEIQYQYWPER